MNSRDHEPRAPKSQSPDRRERRRWLARFLARVPAVRRLLRRLVWFPGTLEIVGESNNSAAFHQMCSAHALERGSSLPLFVPTPRAMEPENFPEHMPFCRCTFWHWFLARGIEREIRTILDVGCGTGFTGHHFICRGFDVTGVTCNLHEKAECLQRGMRVLEDDFHFLSSPDESFDMVFSSHSLEHSIAPLFALWEWKRVLRPGGYLVIVTPMPIEQDARAAYPDAYDSATDSMRFAATGDGASSIAEVGTAASTHGLGLHPFVLGYWQLKWLFRLAGFEALAEEVEDPLAGKLCGIEYVDGRIPADSRRPLNGLFLLQKPKEKVLSTAKRN
jgi:SAM-dependent methyltransferase